MITWPAYGQFPIAVVVAVGVQKGWTLERIETEIKDLYDKGRMTMVTGFIIDDGKLRSTIEYHMKR